MGALFGSLAALGIGLSDLFGRRVSSRVSAPTAAGHMQLVAILVGLVAALTVVDSVFTWADLAVGCVSGLGMGAGLLTYYFGLNASTATVVSPIAATLSAIIPFVASIVVEEAPTALAVTGAVVAIGGLLFVTAGGRPATGVRIGVFWGLVSGTAYGTGFAVMLGLSDDGGAWPAVSQRGVAAVLIGGVALGRGERVTAPAGFAVWATIAGVFAGLTSVFYLLGIEDDPTTTVVTASMFPAVSVGVGRLFYGDDISRRQLFGIALVLVGVAAVVGG